MLKVIQEQMRFGEAGIGDINFDTRYRRFIFTDQAAIFVFSVAISPDRGKAPISYIQGFLTVVE